jgi:hypothetical protein
MGAVDHTVARCVENLQVTVLLLSTATIEPRSIRRMSLQVLESFVGQMTVAELCSRTGRGVEELLAFCSDRRPAKSASTSTSASASASADPTPKAKAKPKSSTKGGKRRVRASSDELVALDERVMAMIVASKDGIGGREMADKTGETLPRLRGSLKRLGDKKKIRHAGNTAARRYWAK